MRYLIAVVGLALAFPYSAHAQAYDWRPVGEQAATLLRAGDDHTALPIIQNALTKCPQAATAVEAGLCTGTFSEHLGTAREHQGNIAAAEEAFREALASRTAVLAANDPRVGQAHFALAAFFQRQNRRTDEVAELQASEAIARANGPDHRTELAGLLTHHAQALDALGRQAEALPLYEDAYTITRETGGPTARDTLIALGNLFTAKVNTGGPNVEMDAVSAVLASPDATAIDPTQRALLAGKLAQDVMGPDRAKAALAFAEAALPDLDNGLVVDPDASFVLLRGAARLNAAIGDSTRAVDLARRARAIGAAKWGPASYAVSNALRTEADADIARHDLRAAIARLSEAAAMLNTPQAALPRTQVEVARADLLARTGHQADAVANDQALIADPIATKATPAIQAAVLVLLGENLNRMAAFEPGGKACARSAELGVSHPALSKDYRVRAELCSGNAALGEGHPDLSLDAAQRAQSALWDGLKAPAEPNRILQFQVTDLRAQALRDLHRNSEALSAYRDELPLAHQLGDISAQGTVMAQIAFVQRQMGLYKDCDDTSVAGLKLVGPNGPP
ncbi:MAG: hypothetical protein QOI16_4244, partial [Pseudonocardiales bacterium]|nr:hypothetical protein [Pseudonocardiales bacterium]